MTSLPGVFTMSFDCEGLWGPSVLTPHLRQRITQENLVSAYQALLDLLDRHELRATFAFVGAFVMTSDEVRQHLDWFESASGRPWSAGNGSGLASWARLIVAVAVRTTERTTSNDLRRFMNTPLCEGAEYIDNACGCRRKSP